MANKTNIGWTNRTWNPRIGCRKISSGCRNCYAIPMAKRIVNMTNSQTPYTKVINDNADNWNGKTCLIEKAIEKPNFGKPCKIFVCSMSDLFYVADTHFQELDLIFDVIKKHPKHIFQILTKRPEVMVEYFSTHDLPDNTWLGVTVESQQTAEERIPQLLRLDPVVAFISIEPMLGLINLETIRNSNLLDWVIVGGETGKNARPMHIDWVNSINYWCKMNEIPFYFKQWGDGNKKCDNLYADIKNFPSD